MGRRDQPVTLCEALVKRLQVARHAVNVGKPMQIDQRRAGAGFEECNLAAPHVDLFLDSVHAFA
jgi:hypothetical protein